MVNCLGEITSSDNLWSTQMVHCSGEMTSCDNGWYIQMSHCLWQISSDKWSTRWVCRQ